MKSEDITWAPLVPLIGGFPLGAERALGKLPEAILSFTDFAGNDAQYVNYMQETRGLDVPYIQLDNEDHREMLNAVGDIDIIVGTPPCAALSQLNTGKSDKVKGASCEKNRYMTWIFEAGIKRFNAKVIIIENAPTLYTNKGKPFADKLEAMAREHDYSFTLYKTSTSLHGVPQNRERTFAIMWQAKHAPMLEWYKRESKNFGDYLKEVPKDAVNNDIVIFPKLLDDPWYNFIKHYTQKDPRDVLKENSKHCITCFNYILQQNLVETALDWFKKSKNEKGIKLAEHAIMKFSKGLGIWDGSVHVFGDKMNACIGRNMNDTIHPFKERSMTVREAFHMMAFPHDFELIGGRKNINLIAQNVPVCTAKDIVLQAKKFCLGELAFTNENITRQNNIAQRLDQGTFGATLTEFL